MSAWVWIGVLNAAAFGLACFVEHLREDHAPFRWSEVAYTQFAIMAGSALYLWYWGGL